MEFDKDVEDLMTDKGIIKLIASWLNSINAIESIAKIDILAEFETNFIIDAVKELFKTKKEENNG